MAHENDDWIQVLDGLPFVREVRLGEGSVELRTQTGSIELELEVRRGVVGRAVVASLDAGPLPAGTQARLLVARSISPGIASELRKVGINFVDGAGNCYLNIDGRYFASIEGRKLPPVKRRGGRRSSSYRVLGASLEEPMLFSRPLRAIAADCGVSTYVVRTVKQQLLDEDALVKGPSGLRMMVRNRYLDEWLVGYRDLVRPKLLVGRYALPHGSLEALCPLLEHALPMGSWSWGGSQASFRMHGTGTTGDVVVHATVLDTCDSPRFPLREQRDGPVEVLVLPYRVGRPGRPDCVTMLSALAELSARRDPRSMDVAAELRENIEFAWKVEDGI